jgi:hypothetical protein
MHQALQGATFHVEHIVPKARGGSSDLGNLAWACPGCNLKKSDRVDATDPQSGKSGKLFHPRVDSWEQHFKWDGYQIVGITAIGRAAVNVLQLNDARRTMIRRAEELFGLFPP